MSCPALPSRARVSVIVGPLGLGSPRFRNELFLVPAVLCFATTAFVFPGRSTCRSLPVPWCGAFRCVFHSVLSGLGSCNRRAACCMPGCWFAGSPSFRLWLPRRREALPSSRITLLFTCPALRPRWCPLRLPWREQDCCLPDTACRRLSVRS